MAKGTLSGPPPPVDFNPGMLPIAPPIAPDELIIATILKFSASAGLTVPAPVALPSAGTTASIELAAIPAGLTFTFEVNF